MCGFQEEPEEELGPWQMVGSRRRRLTRERCPRTSWAKLRGFDARWFPGNHRHHRLVAGRAGWLAGWLAGWRLMVMWLFPEIEGLPSIVAA